MRSVHGSSLWYLCFFFILHLFTIFHGVVLAISGLWFTHINSHPPPTSPWSRETVTAPCQWKISTKLWTGFEPTSCQVTDGVHSTGPQEQGACVYIHIHWLMNCLNNWLIMSPRKWKEREQQVRSLKQYKTCNWSFNLNYRNTDSL